MSKQFQYRCNEEHLKDLDVLADFMCCSKAGVVKSLVGTISNHLPYLEIIESEYGIGILDILTVLIETCYQEVKEDQQEE